MIALAACCNADNTVVQLALMRRIAGTGSSCRDGAARGSSTRIVDTINGERVASIASWPYEHDAGGPGIT